MRIKKYSKSYKDKTIDFQLPDTAQLTQYDFNSISHSIFKNEADHKHGKYAVSIDIAHDDYIVIRGNKEITGGLDLSLRSYANAKPKLGGATQFKNAKRDQLDWATNTVRYFRDQVYKHYDPVRRKQPSYYTSAIKHRASKCLLDKSLVLFIETHDGLEIHVCINEICYGFTVRLEMTKTGQRNAHYTYRPLADCDDDFDDWDGLDLEDLDSVKDQLDALEPAETAELNTPNTIDYVDDNEPQKPVQDDVSDDDDIMSQIENMTWDFE
ncbi:hypothetical protein KI743_18270 [Vibrio sp. D420a]|uniref:hypothetical protein n=1 Tax=Vibrio sp. D420a TaxID=2836895 RepID=UPI002552B66B|nr:hypothetical protein [Vibrio sp. D420a]MDK9763955.1 hypothetical protein [Vibrio sp. D420a]